MQFYIDISKEHIRTLMTWKSNVTLKTAGSSAYERIQVDIRTLRTHFGVTIPMGDFQHIECEDIDGQEDYEYLYIYRHYGHLNYSDVMTSAVSNTRE